MIVKIKKRKLTQICKRIEPALLPWAGIPFALGFYFMMENMKKANSLTWDVISDMYIGLGIALIILVLKFIFQEMEEVD